MVAVYTGNYRYRVSSNSWSSLEASGSLESIRSMSSLRDLISLKYLAEQCLPLYLSCSAEYRIAYTDIVSPFRLIL